MKIIFRRQTRLILIFLLTIFLPSVTLSIFGLIALRNERYKLEQQFRDQQLEFIDSFKTEINQQIGELEHELQQLVQSRSFINRNYQEINASIENHLEENPLSGQFFVAFSGNEPWFPPFRGGGSGYIPNDVKVFSSQQKKKLDQAENYEFLQKNYLEANALLEELLKVTEDCNLQAQLLNHIARNHWKQKNYDKAIENYTNIIQNFPDTRTSSGSLLPVTVRLQLVECYLSSGLEEEALIETLQSFREIIRNSDKLSEDQLSAYVSLAGEKFSSIRDTYPEMISSDTTYMSDFENLNLLCQNKINKWKVIRTLKSECISDIMEDFTQKGEYAKNAHRYSKKISAEDFLIISSHIPDETENLLQGIAGIKICNSFLEESILTGIIRNTDWNEDDSLTVTDMSGRIILGYKATSPNENRITSLFDDNFPPWRIEVSGNLTRPFLFTGIFKSYYFWTILAMMAILGFGIIITGRIIAHEKEILKLKSDFVSSVSHEFKTPITSIKALSERLLEGTMKDQERMREYYSVISQDAEDLSHLVGNILDFSKMEEGKKQVQLEETDFKEWLEETTTNFFSRTSHRRYNIHTPVADPSVRIKIDRNALKLAINNLLDNAVKFSSEDSEIRVITERQGHRVLVKIMDNGIGIPKNEQAKIFEKFYRGKSALDHSTAGTGLGLTLVKQIVEAHGGKVQVESEPGKGSTFMILLPL